MKGSFDKIMEYYRRALIFAKHSGDLKLEVLTLQNMKNTQLEYNRDDLASKWNKFLINILKRLFFVVLSYKIYVFIAITQNELNIVKCCITNEELDDYSEDSDEIQTPDDINLEELSGKYQNDFYYYQQVLRNSSYVR